MNNLRSGVRRTFNQNRRRLYLLQIVQDMERTGWRQVPDAKNMYSGAEPPIHGLISLQAL
ncbi:hypothetical protein D3C81_2123190 [compost metagenome]